MIAIRRDLFGGLRPAADPESLGDAEATFARNCRLQTTKLCPLPSPAAAAGFPVRLEGGLDSIAGAGTIAVWDRGGRRDVIAWKGLVSVAPSNILDDDRHRLFVTGDTGAGGAAGPDQPCVLVSSPGGETYDRHLIHVDPPPPAKVSRMEESADGNGPLDMANLRYAYFFQTWVDEYGYESGMSEVRKIPGPVADQEVGDEIRYNDGDKVLWEGVPADGIPAGTVSRRLYKTVAGLSEQTDAVRFVAEQRMTGSTLADWPRIQVKDEDVGETAPRITAVPADLVWMTAMPGNFYAGFLRGNPRTVCFSDAGVPTSWPDAYRYSVRDDAVGLAVAGNTAFVLTRGYPWAISGADPGGMTAAQIVSEQACVSPRSVCAAGGRVFYASQDGVCALGEGSLEAAVVTRGIWDKAAWSALDPSTCIMKAYDGALFLWFSPPGGRESYIVDFGAGGAPVVTSHGAHASCAFTDPRDDALYYVEARRA